MPITKANIEIPMGAGEVELAIKEYIQTHYHDLIVFLPEDNIEIKLLVGSARVPPGVAVQPKCEGAHVIISTIPQDTDESNIS